MSDFTNSVFSLWPFGLVYCLFLLGSACVCARRDRKKRKR